MVFIFFTIFLFVLYAGIISFYLISWVKIPDYHIDPQQKPATFITVIIPARNEAENIGACLDSIMQQTYLKELFEVIVIDDHSTDITAEIISSYGGNISIISMNDQGEKMNSYKKMAISLAIEKAKGELIVTTDADCITPPKWLETIASFYQQYTPSFIAAPVVYKTTNGQTPLTIFESLDFMTLQGITGAAVSKKFHAMCNGANLAYQKNMFTEVGGFSGIDGIASGDDMLLMHKIFTKAPDKVLFLRSADAIVSTKPMSSLKEFFNQRIRWASKSDKYSDKKIIAVLSVVYLFNVCLLALGIFSFFSYIAFLYFIVIIVSKTIVELIFLYPVATFFRQQKLLWFFPLAQPFHILYTIIAGWLGKFGTYSWKGRTVK